MCSESMYLRSAGLDIKVHPHMLRHACGFALANQGGEQQAEFWYVGDSLDKFDTFRP